MSVCNGESVEREAVHSIRTRGGIAAEQAQCAGQGSKLSSFILLYCFVLCYSFVGLGCPGGGFGGFLLSTRSSGFATTCTTSGKAPNPSPGPPSQSKYSRQRNILTEQHCLAAWDPGAGARQYCMGIFYYEPVRREAVHSIGTTGGAAGERLRSAESRQHRMGMSI